MYIYFEKQANDNLCGQHALNNLLQGPIFNAINLSQIGQNLNNLESYLTNENSNNNVNDTGYFNIQVLEEALRNYGDFTLNSTLKKDFSDIDFTTKEAFICNSNNHWFTVRKLYNTWFNLDSTLDQPKIISDFYLSLFIENVKNNGYLVFVIEGEFKDMSEEIDPEYNNNYLDYLTLKEQYDNELKSGTYRVDLINSGDKDLKRALEESLKIFNNENNTNIPQNITTSNNCYLKRY